MAMGIGGGDGGFTATSLPTSPPDTFAQEWFGSPSETVLEVADEAEQVADPTQRASPTTESLLRVNAFTAGPALASDAVDLVRDPGQFAEVETERVLGTVSTGVDVLSPESGRPGWDWPDALPTWAPEVALAVVASVVAGIVLFLLGNLFDIQIGGGGSSA